MVNSNTRTRQQRPAVAAEGGNRFVVVWDGAEPDDDDVFAQRFQFSDAVPTTTTTLASQGDCADPVPLRAGSSAGVTTATDALFVLRAAVGIGTCELCICDINGSGSITATDALATLNRAVDQPVELLCPPCS
jgi:hypothetical protein